MQKQPFRDRAVATAVLSSVASGSEQRDSEQRDSGRKPALTRRRWGQTGAENLYEKEREEHLEVRRRVRTREIPDEDATFDGTGCFSDS